MLGAAFASGFATGALAAHFATRGRTKSHNVPSREWDQKNDAKGVVSQPIVGPCKVHYWGGRGRAEPLRLLLAAGGVEFENVFIHNAQDFEALNAANKLRYQQVPMVELDGLNLVQGVATANYIARRLGLYPSTIVDQLFVDEICASASDARSPLMRYPWHLNKDKILADFEMERFWGRWESEIPELGSYFLGQKVSIADVVVFEVLDYYEQIFGGEAFLRAMEKYPKLLRLYRKVVALNGVAQYRQYRLEYYLPLPIYAKEVDQTLGR
jgi:glutathione S-transferase